MYLKRHFRKLRTALIAAVTGAAVLFALPGCGGAPFGGGSSGNGSLPGSGASGNGSLPGGGAPSGNGSSPGSGAPAGTGTPEDSTDKAVISFVQSDEMAGLDSYEQVSRTESFLEELADTGAIAAGSVEAYPDMELVSYQQNDGCLCFVDFRDYEPWTSALSGGTGPASAAAPSDGIAPARAVAKNQDNAVIVLAVGLFDDAQENLDYYADAQALFDNTPDVHGEVILATPENMRTGLARTDMAILECHGCLCPIGGQVMTLMRLYTVGMDAAQDPEYQDDVANRRIVKSLQEDGSYHYLVTPYFFEFYYGTSGLGGAIVHLGSCHGFGDSSGADTGDNYVLSNTLLMNGAEAVIGHDNSVYTAYDRAVLMTELEYLVSGGTIGAAVSYAEEQYFDNDRDFMLTHGNQEARENAQNHRASHNEIRGNSEAVVFYDAGGTVPPEEQWPQQGSPDWASAYADILRGYPESAQFILVCVDQDDIPELVVAEDSAHAMGADLYTWSGGQTVYLGYTGTFGAFQVKPHQNTIVSYETYAGISDVFVLGIENAQLVTLETLYNDEYGAPEGTQPQYLINGYSVSRDDYYRELGIVTDESALIYVGYGYGYENTEYYISDMEEGPQYYIAG